MKNTNPTFLLLDIILILGLFLASRASVSLKGSPILDYDPDAGMGFGAYGEAAILPKDTLQRDTCRVKCRLYGTTASILAPFIETDYTKSSLWKLCLRVSYDRTPYNNYFGFGNSDAEMGYSAQKATDYEYYYGKSNPAITALFGIYINDKVPEIFNHSEFTFGIRAEDYGIFESHKVPANGVEPLLFAQRPLGCDGGFIHEEIIGYIVDKRDDIYNPSSGVYWETYFSLSDKRLASSYSYLHGTTTLALYATPIKKLDGLTFASRLLVNYLYGDAPFFKYEKTLAIDPKDIFGGQGSMRGIQQYRYRDPFCYIFTPECRMKMFRLHAFGDDWSLGSVLFSDIGNTFSSPLKIEPVAYFTYGCGLRFGWGNDFVISLDLGFLKTTLNGVYVYFWQQF
jgi:hypothetical protein